MTPDMSRSNPPSQGLYRTTIAGAGRSLPDAFAGMERSPRVERVLRHPKRDLLGARVTLTPEEGRGYWELTRVRDDLYIIQADYAYRDPRFEIVPGDGLIQFNFKISGDMTYAINCPGPLRFNRPALHLWRQPRGVDMREWTAPAAHEQVIMISVRPEFLRDHFLAPESAVPSRLQAFVSEPRDTIDFCELPLTPQMLDITRRLLNNPYAGALYLAYKESLTFELLCVAVGNLLSMPDTPIEEYSERELRALANAREVLTKQFAPPPTLTQLARSVGLSVKALTRGFKSIYGETIFDFSFRSRMEYALTLLRDRAWSIDRTSEAVGYAHPTSFAGAFRRQFGVAPIEMKRLKSRRGIPSKLTRYA